MQTFVGGVLGGALVFQHLAFVPAAAWFALAAGSCVAALGRRRFLAGGLLAGFALGHAHALFLAPQVLPGHLAGVDLDVVGTVASAPERAPGRTRFVFDVESSPPAGELAGLRARVSWYAPAGDLRADQRWRLTLRLKPPRGYANPGGFDFEGWLHRQGIGATGYVREAELLDARAGRHPLARVRETLSRRLAAVLEGRPAGGVVRALVVGDRGGIDDAQWEVFRRTGTSHLMAISGLHIGLVAGFAAWPVLRLWRRAPRLVERWPAQAAAAVAGLAAALPYAALAGFTLPTQRALLMLALGVGMLLARRAVVPSRVLALALLAALVRAPASVVEAGFWLSFGAVALILLALADRTPRGALRNWLRVQAALTFGLAPALVAFGFPLPVSGLLANAVAVPWFGFLVVPTALAGSLLEALGAGGGLVRLAEWLAALSLPVLEALADWRWSAVPLPAAPGPVALALGGLGVAVLLMPRGLPGRPVGAALLLPLVVGTRAGQGLEPGDFRATVLDVGQGLSVVVETRGHVLVYDTGPAFRGGFDTGSRVVAPFLQHSGWQRIDRLVLSHGDNDHVGGAEGLLRHVPAAGVVAGEPVAPGGVPATPCPDGANWRWDDVVFRLAWPGEGWAKDGNDASCVLRVENAAGALLLTGDIELAAEAALVAEHPGMLPAEVVLAPHHGSRTSSGEALVEAADAEWVVYSAGYRNRWGFPVPEVAERWAAAGARAVNTADSGAVTFRFDAQEGLGEPSRYRETHRRYWHRDP